LPSSSLGHYYNERTGLQEIDFGHQHDTSEKYG
jgi:hypothetical protein